MTDLAKLERELFEWHIEKAIDANDPASMAKYLRKLSDHLSPELVNKLADYLDPSIEKYYTVGRKPLGKRLFMEDVYYAGFCNYLKKNKEEARLFFYHEKEAFALVENSEIYDADGNFSPKWKYPHAKRQSFRFPNKGEINGLVSDMYGIGSRNFDDMLARYNKK